MSAPVDRGDEGSIHSGGFTETPRVPFPEPLSPELALVDPELARAARALLPDAPLPPARHESLAPAAPAPTRDQAAFVEELRRGLEPPAAPATAPKPRRRLRALALPGALVLGVLLTLLVRHEAPTPNVAQPAANASVPRTPSVETVALPPVPEPAVPTPPDEPTAAAGQTFVWVADETASAYEFQLFRGAERIYRTRVTAPRVELPASWRQGGRRFELSEGRYRWYVWPVSAAGELADAATVQARFDVTGVRP